MEKQDILDVVDIVLMEKTQIRAPLPVGRMGDGQTSRVNDRHLTRERRKNKTEKPKERGKSDSESEKPRYDAQEKIRGSV